MNKKKTQWEINKNKWRKESINAGFAIDALEEDIGEIFPKLEQLEEVYKQLEHEKKCDSNIQWEDQHKCLLYLVLLGYGIASAARMMGWKTSRTVTENCSRSIYKFIGYLKTKKQYLDNNQNPDDIRWSDIVSVKWSDILEECLGLGYHELGNQNLRELFANHYKREQDIDKISKFFKQEKIKINCQDCSGEERKEIEKLIKILFGI